MARTKPTEQNGTADQTPPPPTHADAQAELYRRMERGVAIRLFTVWTTAGGLSGEKWEWTAQSTRSQGAWLAVARAVMGPAFQVQFGVAEIAALIHG